MSEDEEYTEYNVLREFIDLYKSQPCLWDTKSPNYRCTQQKTLAWELLLAKYKEIDPDANLNVVKQKITSMKAGFQKELRKVNKSILESTCKNDIYEPNLWYFNLLSFLNKNGLSVDHLKDANESEQDPNVPQNDGVYMLIVNDKDEPPRKIKRIKKPKPRQKKRIVYPSEFSHFMLDPHQYDDDKQMWQYTQELEQSIRNTPKGDEESARLLKISPFAVYIGKQLDEMSPYQRNYAEKIISEVIFLGKTDNLSIHSKIETPIFEPPEPQTSKKPKRRKRDSTRDSSPEYSPKVCKIDSKTPSKRPQRHAAKKTELSTDEVDTDIESDGEEIRTLILPRQEPLSNTDCSSDQESVYEVNSSESDVKNLSVNNDSSRVDYIVSDESNCSAEENSDCSTSDVLDRRSRVNDKDSVLRTLLLT